MATGTSVIAARDHRPPGALGASAQRRTLPTGHTWESSGALIPCIPPFCSAAHLHHRQSAADSQQLLDRRRHLLVQGAGTPR